MDIETYASNHIKTRPGMILPQNITTIADLPGASSVLDIGCAEGNTIQWLRSLFPDSLEFYGVDLSQIRIKKAIEKNIPGAVFYEGDAENLPFDDERMRFVVASQVIEHVPDDARMLREIERVLAPGGRFQIDSVLKKSWAFYFYRSPAGWALDPTHIREYTSVESLVSKFPPSLKITDVRIEKCYRRINILCPFSSLPDWVKFRIPGYYTIFVSGRKVT